MNPTEKEREIAIRYLKGEYTDVQMNYMASQCGSDMDRMEYILDKISSETIISNASKIILGMILFHFIACTAYSLMVL